MAIAFNAAADLGNNGGASTSLTASYTCSSGANRLLLVAFEGDVIGGADDVSSVTYAGSAMALAKKQTVGNGSFNRYLYLYQLVNPASGANNVVITFSGTHYVLALAADYTGAAQSGQPDATAVNNVASATSISTSLTTVADNSWAVAIGCDIAAGATTGGTGLTSRAAEGAFGTFKFFDTGAALTPAGSYSRTLSYGGTASSLSMVMASFAPPGASGAYTLTSAEGGFALTGEAVGLLRAYEVGAAEGAFSLTGEAAGLTAQHRVGAGEGSFTLAGEAVAFRYFHQIAGQGSFTLTGEDVNLSNGGAIVVAGEGAFALAGQGVAFPRVYRLGAQQGSFALNGEDALLIYSNAPIPELVDVFPFIANTAKLMNR